MGFVKWHGEKEDHFDEVLRFAREQAKGDGQKLAARTKKESAADGIDVSKLASLRSDEVLRLILKEKRALDLWYAGFVTQADAVNRLGIGNELAGQFYKDFWLYSVSGLFLRTEIGREQQCKIIDIVLNAVLKVDAQIAAQEHLEWMQDCWEYQRYMERGFELKSGKCALFWQWIGYLAEYAGKMQDAERFVKVYFQMQVHLLFYINQMIPGMGIGDNLARRNRLDEEMARRALGNRLDENALKDEMRNPVR